jgi:hypothetical protein
MLGDELGGLISQLPVPLIAMVCFGGGLWLAALIYFAVIRPNRTKRRKAAEQAAEIPAFVPYTAPAMPAAASAFAADMPDLDLLTSAEPEPTPVRATQTAPALKTSTVPAAGARRLSSVDVKLAGGDTIHAQEALIVLRDPRDGKLIVQMGDTGYKSLDGGMRGDFMNLMRELGALATAASAAPPPPPMPVAEPVMAAEPAPAVSAPPVEAAPAPIVPPSVSAAPPSPTGNSVMPGDLPKYSEMKDEIKSRGAFRAAKSEMPPVPELNIPAAIEAYLQYKKQFSPEYAQRSIHVLPAPGGGVRIEVDGMYFESVGDVADPEVRAFLQSTIQEWQKRQ